MVLEKQRSPVVLKGIPIPEVGPNDLLIRVSCCALCRTDLHIVDGELKQPKLPLVLGHQVVGLVERCGAEVTRFKKGDRVGVPWLGKTCGKCRFCLTERENLCESPTFTGYQKDGGFAEYCAADADFCLKIPEGYPDVQAAPFLCGGLIGFRALRMADKAKRLGFYGFGSSAHLLTQIAKGSGQEVYAFTRERDAKGQELAKSLGAVWVGDSSMAPPIPLDAALIFAPVGELVPQALKALDKGGIAICAGIYMTDIPTFPYELLYQERRICSVTNLTRSDGKEFMEVVEKIPIHSTVTIYPLADLNTALTDLRSGKLKGSSVISLQQE
jgi:propanol-preferring alcohol dehydrogenase